VTCGTRYFPLSEKTTVYLESSSGGTLWLPNIGSDARPAETVHPEQEMS
jgi:hypothetical protein